MDKELVMALCRGYDDPDWEQISQEIDYVDEEDGGAWYNTIVQRKSDERFFTFEHNDWDLRNNDVQSEMEEVFPEVKTITVYK